MADAGDTPSGAGKVPRAQAVRTPADRGQWQSKMGFILAAAGSAVGLGNIWKFPYITGENGGGLFVAIYLVCIAVVGLPVMIGEIMIGRAAQKSPPQAFQELAGGKAVWSLVGWMGVVTGFILLSFYSVVAGWAFDYVSLAAGGAFENVTAPQSAAIFGEQVYGNVGRSIFWHCLFMGGTIAIVAGGVQKGIEVAAKVLMPILLVMMVVLIIDAAGQSGFGAAVDFVFAPNTDKLTAAGALEALGHSFFTLSLGMGALITYGSYLSKKDDIVAASGAISVMDTAVALMACMIMFPIIFSYGMAPEAGPGLVFVSMPVALGQLPGGEILAVVFFVLLLFAALTSALSLLEVVVSTVIDLLGWERRKATYILGGAIFVFGLLSAAADADWMQFWTDAFGKNFMDSMDWAVSNVALPLGGLLVAVYVGWVLPPSFTRDQFVRGTRLAGLYPGWLILVRFVAPVAISLVFLYALKIIPESWLR